MTIRTLMLAAIAVAGLATGSAMADEFAGGAILSTPHAGHQLLTDAKGRHSLCI